MPIVNLNNQLSSNADNNGIWIVASGNVPDDGSFSASNGTFNTSGKTGQFVFEYKVNSLNCGSNSSFHTINVSDCP